MGVTHLMRGLPFHEGGGYHHHEEEKRSRGWPHPSWVAAPFLLYILDILLFSKHTWFPFIPYLVAPPNRRTLSKALPKLLATNTWRSGGWGGVPADPYFRCPAEPRAWRTSSSRTCDRVRRRRRLWRLVQDLVIVKWTTMSTTYIFIESSSIIFVRERKPRF
jgi:hypothetical protein